MRVLVQFLLGLLFGGGLIVSGLADPARVLGFLDLAALPAGGWDPGLLLAFLAAVGVTWTGYRLVLRRPRPLLDPVFHLPGKAVVDAPLVVGSAIFGLGWGLAGLCPGPAFTALGTALGMALGTGRGDALLLVAAMLASLAGAQLRVLSGFFNRPTCSTPPAAAHG